MHTETHPRVLGLMTLLTATTSLCLPDYSPLYVHTYILQTLFGQGSLVPSLPHITLGIRAQMKKAKLATYVIIRHHGGIAESIA